MSNYENNLNSMNETENRHSLNTCDWIDEKRALKVKIVLSFTPRGLPNIFAIQMHEIFVFNM